MKDLKIGKELIWIQDSISMDEVAQIHAAVQDLLSKHSEYEVFKAIAAYCGMQAQHMELAPTTRTMANRLDAELMALIQRMALYQHELLGDEE
jgi:hypothetical protein